MKTSKLCFKSSKSPVILLKVIYIILLPATFEAQTITVWPEVTGYVGHDVTLPCQFNPGPGGANVTQVLWNLKPPEGEEISIIVSNVQLGVNVPDTFLKERVEVAEQSLTIRGVELGDAGLYTCTISAFPSGSFEGTTNLVVKEGTGMPILPRLIAAGVFVLIVVTMLVTTHCIIRRHGAFDRKCICSDADDPVMCD